MNLQLFCQAMLLVALVSQFFYSVYCDFNGREASGPAGFKGFVFTAIFTALAFVTQYVAGTYSLIFQ